MEIRALRASDDRSGFDCGDEALNRFFRRYAGQNQFKHYLGVTYVAAELREVLGYATVSPRHLAVDDLPEATRRKLPRYPVPVLGLARLAVDRGATGLGIGRQLLRFVLGLSLKMSEDLGCAGVIVDAKPQAVGFYERYGFSSFEALEGESAARPRTTMMWLPIRAVLVALGHQR